MDGAELQINSVPSQSGRLLKRSKLSNRCVWLELKEKAQLEWQSAEEHASLFAKMN